MLSKDRALTVLQILQEKTDDEQMITTAELIAELQAWGVEASVRTLRTYIRALQENGFDITVREEEGKTTRYAFLDRDWSLPELRLLVDAVSAAQFIPLQRSEELIRKLSVMAGPSYAGKLQPRILVSERIKAKNKKMIYTVEAVQRAISQNKKISFSYLEYTPEKEQVPKHAGTPEEKYVVSPYATVWNNDRYYLVGWSDKRNKVTVYRIDRMEVPKQLREKRVPEPESFDVRDYADKVFWMYDGPEAEVTLKCKRKILDQVIDRFGENIELKNVCKTTFEVTVPVRLSSTFYAWVFQFAGEMSILAPEGVREMYAASLQEAIDETLGG